MIWTDEKIWMVEERYKRIPTQALADLLGTTKNSVIGKARRLGLCVEKPEVRRRIVQSTRRAGARKRGFHGMHPALIAEAAARFLEWRRRQWQMM